MLRKSDVYKRQGIPQTAEERLVIAGRILEAARRHGIPREKVLIDCLTLTVSAQQAQAAETLRAVRMVREQLGLRTVLGEMCIRDRVLSDRQRDYENRLAP